MRFRLPVALLVALSFPACERESKGAKTISVLVSVDSDVKDLASVQATVLDSEVKTTGGMQTWLLGKGKAKLPVSFTVVPEAGANGGSFVVRVEGLDEDGKVIVSVQAWARFVPGETRLLTLRLDATCEGIGCEIDQTCHYDADDRFVGACGDVLNPPLTEHTSSSDDLSRVPVLRSPGDGDSQEPSDEPVDASRAALDATLRGQDAASAPDAAREEVPLDDSSVSANDAGTPLDTRVDGSTCSSQSVNIPLGGPDVLIVFDRSLSMSLNNRWEPSKQAIKTVINEFQALLAFGLELFPGPGASSNAIDLLLGGTATCGGGEILDVSPLLGNAGPIATALDRTMTQGLTPTGSALQRALTFLGDRRVSAGSTTKPAFVLLVTDGDPVCDPTTTPDNAQREQARVAVRALKDKNIPTYVVGYQIDPAFEGIMNELAELGGTTSYRAAQDGAQLLAGLHEVVERTIGCVFSPSALQGDPAWVRVTLDKQAIALDSPDGFAIQGRTLTLQGAACSRLQDGKGHELVLQTPCTTGGP